MGLQGQLSFHLGNFALVLLLLISLDLVNVPLKLVIEVSLLSIKFPVDFSLDLFNLVVILRLHFAFFSLKTVDVNFF